MPTVGVAGADGAALITTLFDALEVHPPPFTVNVYVFGARPLTVVLVPLPLVVTLPGLRVNVQLPAGNPLRSTEPVGVWQLG